MQKGMLFWIWLAEALGPANRDFRALISIYENPYDIFHAEEEELERLSLSDRTRKKLADKNLSHATDILDVCERSGIGILAYSDGEYPNTLRQIDSPPVLLYYSGTLPDFNTRLCVGMVGTRRMSAYGLRSAYKLAYELASTKAMVISGMAAGIDGVSAAAAIAAKGTTVAILGCGVDVVYPRHHQRLRDEIRRTGVILSEYPPGTRPNSYHFPIRNRLISGLSHGTVVVEAGIGSGSLITAKDAIVQGRDVFAIPANVGSVGAEGTNGLLRDGANLVTQAKDILDRYAYVFSETLDTARLLKIGDRSEADLAFLEQMGVITLHKGPTPQSPRLQATAPIEEAAPKPKKRAAKPSGNRKGRTDEAVSAHLTESRQAREAEAPTARQTPDEVLTSLNEVQRAVLEAIPDDRAIHADALCGLDFSYGDIVAALTMLEILGLIQKLPGALYTKK